MTSSFRFSSLAELFPNFLLKAQRCQWFSGNLPPNNLQTNPRNRTGHQRAVPILQARPWGLVFGLGLLAPGKQANPPQVSLRCGYPQRPIPMQHAALQGPEELPVFRVCLTPSAEMGTCKPRRAETCCFSMDLRWLHTLTPK